MVMELLEGGRFDQMIAKGEMLDEWLVLKIGADVAEGLNAAANINLIHGDVKPENILLDNNGVAKVVDFGLSRFKERSEGGVAHGIWGTPYYIAPEKLRGHPADARSDIYSLGGTLFHALTLKPPFDGDTPMDVVKARLKQAAPSVRSIRPEINHEVEAIVARMLEADPARRYPNYASAISDLRRAMPSLNPHPVAAYGATTKKGGKIILAKKKTGPASASGLSLPDAQPESSAGGRVAKPVRRTGRVIGWSVFGVCLLAGLVAGGWVWHRATLAEAARGKEKRQIAGYRKELDAILLGLQGVATEVSNREGVVRAWSSNAVQSVTVIKAGLDQLPDPGEYGNAGTQAADCAAVVDRYGRDTLAVALRAVRDMSEQVSTNRQALLALTNAASAALRLAAVTNLPLRSADLRKSLVEPEEKARKALETLEALKQKLDKAVKANQVAAAKDAADKAVAERAETARAAAEQAAAAEKVAREQAEVKLIEESRKANVALIQQHQFTTAVEALGRVARGLKTDAGKAAGRQAVSAYQKLVELKSLFVEGLRAEVKADPEKGYSYGWLKSADILGASEEKLTLRGGQVVLWNAVPPREMILLYQHYVENGTLLRREKAQHEFAMALYIYDTMSGNEAAAKQVAKYLGDALKGNPSLEEQSKVVMPDIDTK
ncbi:MAG: serine/threonine-protein kinase, partial [bacterium]